MWMFSITKPRKKIKGLLTAIAFLLLLGIGVPLTYDFLKSEDAMSGYAENNTDEVLYVNDDVNITNDDQLNTAEIEIQNMTGDPIKVNADENVENKDDSNDLSVNDKQKGFLEKILEVIFGAEENIIYYNVE